jgi:hypothetical protein
MASGSEAFRVGVMPLRLERSPPPARGPRLLATFPIEGEA